MSDVRETMANELANELAVDIQVKSSFDCFRIADAILSALAEAGYVIVPREPTERQIDFGVAASTRQSVSAIYRAMVGAKPDTATGRATQEG